MLVWNDFECLHIEPSRWEVARCCELTQSGLTINDGTYYATIRDLMLAGF